MKELPYHFVEITFSNRTKLGDLLDVGHEIHKEFDVDIFEEMGFCNNVCTTVRIYKEDYENFIDFLSIRENYFVDWHILEEY